MLNYYKWLFNVNEDEERKEEVRTRRENLAVFESTNISETKEVTPTKIGVHVCYINTYLHDFFEPILSN